MGNLEGDLASFMDRQYRTMIDAITRPRRAAAPDPDAFVFCSDARTGQPIGIDPAALSTGMVMLGGTGSGKSNGVRALCESHIHRKRRRGEGFSVVDIHGTVARWVRDCYARHLPLLADHFYYLDLRQLEKVLAIDALRHGDGESFSIAQSVGESFLRAYGAAASSEKPLAARMFVKLGQALRDLGLALTEARFFLSRSRVDRAVFRSLVEQLPMGELRSFWENYEQLGPTQADTYSLGVANRTDCVTNVAPLRRMFGQVAGALDFKRAMDEGYVVVFDLSREGTDVSLDAQTLSAALIVECFNQAIESRTPDTSLPHTIILDESSQYLSTSFARTLLTMRKFCVRAVLVGQSLSHWIPRDQDRRLLDAVLAVPCKMVFGRLPFDQAKLLAEQMFLPMLDPAQIKFQPTSIAWDPKPTLVTLRGGSRSGGRGESHARSTSRGRSSARSRSTMKPDGGGRGSSTDSETEGESEGESQQYTFSRQSGWSESWHEAYVTFYEKREQNLPPMFASLDEQIFSFAQRMNLSGLGRAVLELPGSSPREVRIAHKTEIDLSDLERRRFMSMYQSNRGYLDLEVSERAIEERQAKLITAARPLERTMAVSGGTERGKRRARKLRLPS